VSRDDRERLADIGDAVRTIQSYARKGAATGPVSDITRDAILFRFVVIGEAIKGLSPAVRERDHDNLLRRFAGLRDVLTHEYFRIDLETVEAILNERLPLLHELVNDLHE
jgi:uncharacterized protein with HEPN domain